MAVKYIYGYAGYLMLIRHNLKKPRTPIGGEVI